MRIVNVDFDKLKSCVKDSNIDKVQRGYILDFIDDCVVHQNRVIQHSVIKKRNYTASLGKGRKNSYIVTFRHPMILDKDGYGRKIRRGLGSNELVAKAIVTDVNLLLKGTYWHDYDKESEAMKVFCVEAVKIFYN